MSLNPFQLQQTAPPQKKIFEPSFVAQPIQQTSPQQNSPNKIAYNQQQQIQYQNPCHYHPQQYITNFCSNPECQLPLCPICVDVHIKEHTTAKGSIAIIEHIDQIIGRNLQDIKELQREEMLAREELNSIEVQRHAIEEEMLAVSNIKRQQCHELIEQYFDQLNASIKSNFEGLSSEQNKEVNQIRHELNEINKKASREEKNLSNPDKVLGTIIQTNQTNKKLILHEALTEQRVKLHSFQQKLPLLSVNDGEFANLNILLAQLIKIENQRQQTLQQGLPQQRMIQSRSSQQFQPTPTVIYQSSMPPSSNLPRQQAIQSQYARQQRLYQYPQPRTSFQYPY